MQIEYINSFKNIKIKIKENKSYLAVQHTFQPLRSQRDPLVQKSIQEIAFVPKKEEEKKKEMEDVVNKQEEKREKKKKKKKRETYIVTIRGNSKSARACACVPVMRGSARKPAQFRYFLD